MKTHLTAADVTATNTHEFCTSASDLGWPAGHWPEVLTTTLGNGMPLFRGQIEGDGEKAVYNQQCGCIAVGIFND